MKKIITGAIAVIAAFSVAACGTQAGQASRNISFEAENFQVDRRLVVINTITDKPQFELSGKFSIVQDSEDDQLEVTIKMDNGKFKKHTVGLTPTVTYVVEDISGADVSPYRDQISYLPERIIPVDFQDGSSEEGWEGDGK